MLEKLNGMSIKERRRHFERCCGSSKWIDLMSNAEKKETWKDWLELSSRAFDQLEEEDWLEAFRHHPKIGDIKSLQKKFASTAAFAQNEQAAVKEAPNETLVSLKQHNDQYFSNFGFIFIVCATGKSASEMLSILQKRLGNSKEEEMLVAAEEQRKITKIRLENLEV